LSWNQADEIPGLGPVRLLSCLMQPLGFWLDLFTWLFSYFSLFYLILYHIFLKRTGLSHSNTKILWLSKLKPSCLVCQQKSPNWNHKLNFSFSSNWVWISLEPNFPNTIWVYIETTRGQTIQSMKWGKKRGKSQHVGNEGWPIKGAMADADKILVAQICWCKWALQWLFQVQQHSSTYSVGAVSIAITSGNLPLTFLHSYKLMRACTSEKADKCTRNLEITESPFTISSSWVNKYKIAQLR